MMRLPLNLYTGLVPLLLRSSGLGYLPSIHCPDG